LLAQLQKSQDAIEKLKSQSKELYDNYQHIATLANIADGKNSVKQKFEAYVLSVFLDEVLQYANKRLDLLSQGRYQLLIKTEFTGGGKDTSLDLEVFDSYNNKKRDVQSLSGGETFFTSLALALGLADVATARAGGLKLDAIFIDEGFGTLDSETLDLAIRTLTNLDGEHRLVGIISHVGELKERISGRLEVIKEKNGSFLKVVA
ncbi:MAG: SMC family ATPase, partial [Verrucomicrobia bacterium]|nr:SMC family ATPase [Cytophagales bacterium]